jgi:hypothetical protein
VSLVRRLIPWFVFGAAAAASALFLVWLILAQQTEARILEWVEARRAEGYVIAWSRFDIGGFPLRILVEFADAKIAKDATGAEAPLVTADLAPWRPDRIDLAAPRLDLAGPEGRLVLESVTAALHLDGGRAARLLIDSARGSAQADGDGLGQAESVRLAVTRFAPEITSWREESLAGQVSLRRVRPAARFAAQMLFEDPFDIDLTGAIKGDLHDVVKWRDGGGTIELERLLLAWGPLRVDGNATIALDGEMRPLGAGTAKLRGLMPTVDRLVAKGQMKPQDAATAKIVLGLLSQPTADGGSEVAAPVTAQNGQLFLGPVPVARLLPWKR